MSTTAYVDGPYKIVTSENEYASITIVKWLNDNGDSVKISRAGGAYLVSFYSETIPWTQVGNRSIFGSALNLAKDILRTEKIRKEHGDGYGTTKT